MSTDYWLGVATIPLLAGLIWAAFIAWVLATEALRRQGITVQAKVRDTGKISEYTLRHDIWWGALVRASLHRGLAS